MGRGTEWGPKLARIKGGAKTSAEHQSSNQGTAATMRAFVVSSASPGRSPVSSSSSSLRAFSHLSFYSFFFYLVAFLFFLFYFTLYMYRLFFFVFGPLSLSLFLRSFILLSLSLLYLYKTKDCNVDLSWRFLGEILGIAGEGGGRIREEANFVARIF